MKTVIIMFEGKSLIEVSDDLTDEKAIEKAKIMWYDKNPTEIITDAFVGRK